MGIYSHGRENAGIKALKCERGWYFPGIVNGLGWQLATRRSHWGNVTFKLIKSPRFSLDKVPQLFLLVSTAPSVVAVLTIS